MNLILCIDFGSTYTKLTAIDIDKESIVATTKSATTVQTNIMDGFNKAFKMMEEKINPKDVKWVHKFGCSSAAGGLKMCVIGNVPELTADAAKKAALGAGARVLKTYYFEQTTTELNEMISLDVDIVLLAGGTDGGNKKFIIDNAKLLANHGFKKPIIVAGNKSCQDEIKDILTAGKCTFYITENIMPQINSLNITPARETIRKVFMDHIINAKGLSEVTELVENEIIPTPLAVLRAAYGLSMGSDREEGIGELVVVDIGGATTDIHSIAEGKPTRGDVNVKGMDEPFDKRTVEGDLGMRYSAKSLIDAVTTRKVQSTLAKCNIEMSGDEIHMEIDKRSKNVDFVPVDEKDRLFDQALAMVCTEVGMTRHTGYIEMGYSLFGPTYNQYGKDLTNIKAFIGTGGVIVHSDNPSAILESGSYSKEEGQSLKPINAMQMIDKEYVLSALGLVYEYDKDLAVRLLKKYITEIKKKGN